MVRHTLLKIWKFGSLCILLPGAIVTIFPEYCLMIYTDSPELIQASVPILYLAAITQLSMCAGLIYFECVSGSGNTAHALILEGMVLVGYLFLAWFFAIKIEAGVFWVWTSEIFYGVLCFVFCFTYVYKYNWGTKKI